MFWQKLIGIRAIADYLGVVNDMTIHDWLIAYDLPCRKEKGIYVARKSDLARWQKKHLGVREQFPEPRDVFEHRWQRGRWGLFKLERRKIKK